MNDDRDRLDLHVHMPERLELHVHLHEEPAGRVTGLLLDAIRTQLSVHTGQLQALQAQGVKSLMASAETRAVVDRIEKATTDLGVRIRAIQERNAATMTAEDNAELAGIAGNLEGMAKNPDEPIPPQV
jgi:hypothetical protein